MKILGLTGGIGMGKSTVAEWFARRGVPVADTDQLAREVVEPGQPAWREVCQAFGQDVVDDEGRLRRAELARRVFADESMRRTLEGILHPRIRDKWKAQVKQWQLQGQALSVVVIPLLFETQAEAEFDDILCVACSAVTQRQAAGSPRLDDRTN